MKLERTITYKSYLHPMIHTFKNSSGRITRQYLCYAPAGKVKVGKADHKYDPEKCGWQGSLDFLYIGPYLCCRRCHRHIWGKESYDKCPQCHRSLGAQSTASHSVTMQRVPLVGNEVTSYTRT